MTKGERIKLLREKANMTQEELAKLLNTTKQTIYKYEQSVVTNIPSDRVERIAEVLNTTPAYIMGWESDKPETSKKIDAATDVLIRMETDKLSMCWMQEKNKTIDYIFANMKGRPPTNSQFLTQMYYHIQRCRN